MARALGELISRVQATPCFPFFVNYADIVARACSRMCGEPVCLRKACLIRM